MTGFWVTPTSSMVYSRCGETTTAPLPLLLPFIVNKDNKLASALDANTSWHCDTNHTHNAIFDLGKSHYITSLRGVLNVSTNLTHVKLYVSDDPTVFGTAIMDVADWQSYSKGDDDPWEVQPCTPKVGRYVKIEVLTTTDPNNYLRWG